MSNKNMSDVLLKAHEDFIKQQAKSNRSNQFNPIKQYAETLPVGSQKPRGQMKRRG